MALNFHLSQDMKGKWVSTLEDLFIFFACHSKGAFKKPLEYLFTKYKISLMRVMLKLFMEEGLDRLQLFVLPFSFHIFFFFIFFWWSHQISWIWLMSIEL